MPIDYSQLPTREKLSIATEKLEKEIAKETREYELFLLSATQSPRLNEWEEKFISSLCNGFNLDMCTRFAELSERQQEIVKKIEKKIYAAG